jgi:hypothetical protein
VQRSDLMAKGSAADLDVPRAEAARCTNCDLYKNTTQAVFGEAAATAGVLLVGSSRVTMRTWRGVLFWSRGLCPVRGAGTPEGRRLFTC